MMRMNVATCQFPVSADINQNTKYILRQMVDAKDRGADVIHFPEACLSGYAGSDMESLEHMDWHLLERKTRFIMDLAGRLKLWVIVGSTHRLSGSHKPHNSLYIINDEGKLIDRYDKMFCAGDQDAKTGDLAHYTPGNHFSVFQINGITCGTQICHDYRYPELYREYKKQGVEVMFHSYHAANVQPETLKAIQSVVDKDIEKYNPAMTYPGITMPATMISYAANNYIWISCSNSSAKESLWASFFVRPDGITTGRLKRNVTGILMTPIDTTQKFYDSTIAWRENAMNQTFHSGTLVEDERSSQRTEL